MKKSGYTQFTLIAVLSLSVVGCSTSDPYRDAPESQIYAIEEVEPANRVTIVKQASSSESETTTTTVQKQQTQTEEYEEEVEEIEILHSAAEKEEVVQQASSVEKTLYEVNDTFDCDTPYSERCDDGSLAAGYEVQQEASSVVVEDTLVDRQQVSHKTVITKTASSSFIDGYYSLGKKCNVRLNPGPHGEVANVVSRGTTLWVEDFSPNWAKVNRRSGAAYINKQCLSVE